jgi:hypothetical protein
MKLTIGKSDLGTFSIVLLFGACFFCFYAFLFKAIMVSSFPDSETLCRWDAGVYRSIMLNGYTYDDPRANNSGCYILFPLIWRWSHLGVMGIGVLNYIFFAAGFTLLAKLCKISLADKLIWLSVPTVYIMFIPYTEALFFLLMTLTFWGIVTKNRWLLWSSLFLAALTRATALFLLPSLLVMELVCNNSRFWYKVVWLYCIDYAAPIIAGTALFVWYQHHEIGKWFAYFIQQRKYEGHEFNWPILPFSSMEGFRNLWISGLALFCCFISIILVVKYFIKWLLRNAPEPNKLLVLSAMFLAITFFKTMFYNPTWGTLTTLTIGINRYVFATPFFFVLLHYFTKREVPYKPRDYMLVFILCNIVWLSCGAYVHIVSYLYFSVCTAIVFLYMQMADKKQTWPPMLIMGVNMIFLIIMFQQYLADLYLD